MKPQILQTKLIPPQQNPNWIKRERVVEAIFADLLINDKFTRPLTLISAPPGYGKTSLLIDCSTRLIGDDRKSAWLSVSIEDNSPLSFLTYLLAAIKKADNTFAPEADEYLLAIKEQGYERDSQKQLFQELLLYLLNQLSQLDQPLFIILDELEKINSPEIDQLFLYLIENLPASAHIIAASRKLNNWPVSTWQGTGKAKLFTKQELKFNLAEADLFFQNHDLPISDKHVRAVFKMVDGWITGLRLISSIIDSDTIDQILGKELPAGIEQIFDYVLEEVLADVPRELKDFLMMTAPLYKFNAQLAAIITGKNNFLEFIDEISKRQLFLEKLPGQETWFRYQTVFAGALENKLYIERPVLKEEIAFQAADWFNDNGMVFEAVEQLLAGSYFNKAAGILFENFGKLINQGEIFTLKNWLRRFPPRLVLRRPSLKIMEILTQVMDGHFDEAVEGLNLIRLNLSSDKFGKMEADKIEMIEGLCQIYEIIMAAHMNKELNSDLDIQAILKKIGQDRYWQQFAGIFYGNEMVIRGNLEQALEIYSSVKFSGYSFQIARIKEAYIYWYRGDLNKTNQILDEIIFAGDDNFAGISSIQAFARIIKGIVLVERNQLEEAEEQFSGNFKIVEEIGEKTIKVIASIYRLSYYLSLGELQQAKLIEEKLIQYRSRVKLPFHNYFINGIQARLWLELENPDSRNWREVKNFLEDKGVNLHTDMTMFRDEEFLSLSRALIQGQKYHQAEDLLNRLIDFSLKNKLRRTELKSRLLLANIYYQTNCRDAALKQVQTALNLALEGGFFRTIVEEGAPLREILTAYSQSSSGESEYLDFIKDLLANFPDPGSEDDIFNEQPLIEPLSQRELEILREIAAGMTNQQIAERLHISLNTVKWHTGNIYGKLNVNNRTQAVDSARELNII